MTVDVSNMTPEQLEEHIAKELKLKADIEGLLQRLENSDYTTKTEKMYLNEQYREKFRELNIHLGYESADD